MNEVYCSTGAFIGRVNGRDPALIARQGGLLACDGLEFMIFSDWYPRLPDVLDMLADSGLRFPTVHADKRVTEALASREGFAEALALVRLNCQAAARLGARLAVLHLWPYPCPAERMAELVGECRTLHAAAADLGVELSVECIPHESMSPLQYMGRLIEACPALRVTLDTRHSAYQGEAEAVRAADWLWAGHVAHFHITDYAGRPHSFDALRDIRHPGAGEVDFAGWFARCKAAGYDGGFTLEANSIAPQGIGDLALLNRSLAFIQDGIR